MGKSSAMGVGLAAAAVYGSYQASQVFVPSALAPRATEGPALRGTSDQVVSYESQASSSSTVPVGLLATGALGMMAMSKSRGSRTVRSAAAAPAAPAAEKKEAPAPPPPPPFDPASTPGVSAPLGFFDPLGFSKKGDKDGFRKLRVAELKHGRVAMMASVGAVIQHYSQFPGFENVPKGLFAVTSMPGTAGFAVLFAVSGALELLLWTDDPKKSVNDVGDFGNPFQLGIGPALGGGDDMRTRELNHGRAAMFATLGIVVAELATGKDGMQQMGFA